MSSHSWLSIFITIIFLPVVAASVFDGMPTAVVIIFCVAAGLIIFSACCQLFRYVNRGEEMTNNQPVIIQSPYLYPANPTYQNANRCCHQAPEYNPYPQMGPQNYQCCSSCSAGHQRYGPHEPKADTSADYPPAYSNLFPSQPSSADNRRY